VLPHAKLLNAQHEPYFLDMRMVLYAFDVFFAFDDGIAAVPVILWSRSCVYVLGVHFVDRCRMFDRHEVFAHC
jgi:hypothetical protein